MWKIPERRRDFNSERREIFAAEQKNGTTHDDWKLFSYFFEIFSTPNCLIDVCIINPF
jgi:hypothetical protein